MLYFIKSGNYCKIGFTKNLGTLFNRLRNYLTHNPSFQILDIRQGDKIREEQLHSMIPPELYHYGEWCLWSKDIARLWIRYYKVNIKKEQTLEEYFIKRNKSINQAIVSYYRDTPYLNFIRYFSKESNLDLEEPKETQQWRTP